MITDEFNAGWAVVGLRRRRVLFIGLPLWNVLTGPERIGVVGHEIGHEVNGDPAHGLVVGTSLDTLESVHYLLSPSPPRSVSGASLIDLVIGFAEFLARQGQRLVAGLVGLLYSAVARLKMRAGQRAEYLADKKAAQMGSSAALASALDAMMTTASLSTNTLRTYENQRAQGAAAGDKWARQREAVAEMPELERERRRRLAERAAHTVDATHPPTHLRIALLQGMEPSDPLIVLPEAEWQAIDEELGLRYTG